MFASTKKLLPKKELLFVVLCRAAQKFFIKVAVIVKPCTVSTCLWLEQKSTRYKSPIEKPKNKIFHKSRTKNVKPVWALGQVKLQLIKNIFYCRPNADETVGQYGT